MTNELYTGFVVADDFNVHMNGGWWAVMMLGMVLFWVLVVVAIVWAVRTFGRGDRAHEPGQTPLELLQHRFAERSISVEEYEERRRVLLGTTGGEASREGGQPIAREG